MATHKQLQVPTWRQIIHLVLLLVKSDYYFISGFLTAANMHLKHVKTVKWSIFVSTISNTCNFPRNSEMNNTTTSALLCDSYKPYNDSKKNENFDIIYVCVLK